MTTGGIFQLITNDGRQDEMLLGTSWLKSQLKKITAAKMSANMQDISPDIKDIEVTHFFPMISHFKPLVAVAFEYQVINPQSVPQWGSELLYSLQQFGEFINDIVIQVSIDPVSAANSSFWTNSSASNASGAELVSYVNHPGHAIFAATSFEVNGNSLDAYTSDVINFYQKFYIKGDKQIAWDRMMGQEIPRSGYTAICNSSISGSSAYRNAGVRQLTTYVDGYQTPKPMQPQLTMFIPLLFWFNLDPSKAIPSVAIPYGQRFIRCQINKTANLLQHHHAYYQTMDNQISNPITVLPTIRSIMYANNIFVNSEIHDLFVKKIGFYLIRVYKQQVQQINVPQGRELLQNLKWPIETIYTAFQPTSNLAGPYRGDTWNQYGIPSVVTVNNNALQNGYNWGVFPTTHTQLQAQDYTAAFLAFNLLALDFATTLGVVPTTVLTVDQVNYALTQNKYPPLLNISYVNPSTPTAAEIIAATPGPCQSSYYITYTPTVDTITFVAQAINLYPALLESFFSSYIPFTYINEHMRCSTDPGAYMTTFSLYTGITQPSGYINVSRAREFYIYWTSSYISTANTVNLIVIAVAINFLLISDGSAVLRFAT